MFYILVRSNVIARFGAPDMYVHITSWYVHNLRVNSEITFLVVNSYRVV